MDMKMKGTKSPMNIKNIDCLSLVYSTSLFDWR